MTQVSAEQRQKAKAIAANLAVAANDAAVALGIASVVAVTAGAVSGAGAPAGVFVGAALAVGSFGSWYIGIDISGSRTTRHGPTSGPSQ